MTSLVVLEKMADDLMRKAGKSFKVTSRTSQYRVLERWCNDNEIDYHIIGLSFFFTNEEDAVQARLMIDG